MRVTATVDVMARFAALLRGITPSGRDMTNDKLRGVCEGLGLLDVGSVPSSGNLVFRSDITDTSVLEAHIEDALAVELGVSSRPFVRTYAELRALVDSDPFPGVTHGAATYLTATFTKDADPRPHITPEQLDPGTTIVGYDPAARAVLAITDNSEPNRSRGFMLWLEHSYGKDITTRTWLTVQRIVRALES